jgi:hypothetical protein
MCWLAAIAALPRVEGAIPSFLVVPDIPRDQASREYETSQLLNPDPSTRTMEMG